MDDEKVIHRRENEQEEGEDDEEEIQVGGGTGLRPGGEFESGNTNSHMDSFTGDFESVPTVLIETARG